MIIKLEQKHKDFIKNEFGIDDIDIIEDEIFFNIYDKLIYMEIDEFEGGKESDRGYIIVDIMDYMAEQFEYDNEDVANDNKTTSVAI